MDATDEVKKVEDGDEEGAGGFDRYGTPQPLHDWNIEVLDVPQLKYVEICNTFNLDQRDRHFDYISSNYEGFYTRAGYPDPKEAADMLQEVTKGQNPADLSIIDFGCGTGFVGEKLKEHGFTNIVGVDLSQGMMDIASTKNCYKSLEKHILGDADNFPVQWKNKFDVVILAGLLNNNHLEYQLIEEMIMTTKQNGLIVFSARYSMMGNYWYTFYLKELEAEGRIKLIKSKEYFKYTTLGTCVGRFSKTPCKTYAYKNLCPEINGYKTKVVLDNTFTAFPKDVKDS